MLTQQTLKEHLHYDPETGVFTWLVDRKGKAKAGSVAGFKHHSSYIYIKLFGKRYAAHRLAFLYMKGYLPKFVDHKNCIRYDNWFDNLRECSRSDNNCNAVKRRDNKSGVKGVYYHKQRGRWAAQVKHNKVCYHLGLFDSVAEAEEVVKKKREELHREFTNHGETHE
ncbi:HNH homing endonuclease [Salmonella phage vB_SalM_SPJ41]|uniref:HNH homing endonuclease n=1 Tax=Salmonella phage vB_SalM_SPJ41 TaxID=2961840 RepID=A0A9E7P775_9CAUD|nr:HNH homing endonuclease [Salmonella phage vB_SalM_SPJ41]